MQNILLLGAGFSKNWGGPLASEVFYSILADKEIQNNEELKKLLWENRNNFENAIANLQEKFIKAPNENRGQLVAIMGSISRMFSRMNEMFSRQQFHLTRHDGTLRRIETPQWFLSRFDAIFTLNQDLLLEIHYFDKNENASGERQWNGSCWPGVTPIGGQQYIPNAWAGKIWVPRACYELWTIGSSFLSMRHANAR
jgi:hypothetical protein